MARGGRGSRPPRGRDRSHFSRPPGGDDNQGELNAGLTERFGRGPTFRPRNNSQPPSQPVPKANVEVARYFTKRRIGAGAPRWTTRPEVPHPEELLPYLVLPTQDFVPNDSGAIGWSSQEPSGWGGNDEDGAGGWGADQQVSEAPPDEAKEASREGGIAQSDAWATESKATDAWSTQPASGDNWQQDTNGDTWAPQETGDGWADDAWVQANPAVQADIWQDQNGGDTWNAPVDSGVHDESTNDGADDSSAKAEKNEHDGDLTTPDAAADKGSDSKKGGDQEQWDSLADASGMPAENEIPQGEQSANGEEPHVEQQIKHNAAPSDPSNQDNPPEKAQALCEDGWGGEPAAGQGWGNNDQETHWNAPIRSDPANEQETNWNAPAPNDGNPEPESHWNASAPGVETTQEDDDTFESFENVTNIVDGPWPSKIEYLRTHYLLLREEALRPLREAVEHVRSMSDLNEDPSRSTIGIYDQVQVCGLTFAKRGLGVRVKFSLGRVGKNIHWAQSKRLIAGTIVILMSPDKSKCKIAIVAARPLELLNKNPPEVDLFFGRSEDLDIDCSQDWIMMEERGGFFEAQRHTLVALQRMVHESFPLQEHLVKLETSIPPPTYITNNPIRDLRPISSREQNQQILRNVDVLQQWPSNIHPNLDDSQMNALNTILTKRLSIVQGPPGTGKTYVSVEALKVMLQNLAPGDPPIIITCQTNHALDQLLGHVSKFEPAYVRIGARSGSEEIKKRTLYELKQDRRPPPFKGQHTWKKLESEIAKLVAPLIKGPTGPESRDTFDLELLRELGVLSHDQCDSMIAGANEWVSHEEDADDRPLLKWIGKQLEPVRQRHHAALMGYEEIDEGNIGFEEVMEQDAEQVIRDEDEYEGLGGTFWAIGDTWTGRAIENKQARDQAKDLLKTKTDLWKIRSSDRGNVYRHIQREAKIKITQRLRQIFPQYERACEDRKIARWEFEETILKENKIVGLTTTGVSKYRGLIASLRPKVVLIEEAAETLEGPVIAACMESVEHLVLVGDHKQLRPNTHVMALSKPPYNLNISLFERMVNNDVSYSVLQKQRRMKPEIRRMLKPIYENKIKDNKSVMKLGNRPPVPGMGGLSTWFFTHEYPDERDQEFSSFNTLEAEMILGLVQYLHYNGMEASKITILTFYNGQRRLIRRLFGEDERARGNADLRNVQLVTVDSYQGEENDVVILSLVRSNMDGRIGFIGVDNRICVALSRAQRGFYILGNAQMLCGESWLWSQVVTLMANGYVSTPSKNEEQLRGPELNPGLPERRIGYTLPLWCKRHKRQFWIQDPADWRRNVGGCDLFCRGRLPCGHACIELCHPWPHEMYSCKEPCRNTLPCGHRCSRECYQTPCECKQGCKEGSVMNNAALSSRALSQSPEQASDAAERYQQYAQNGAADDRQAMAAYLARTEHHEKMVQMENQVAQKQLDDENAKLLFKDDANQTSMNARLIDFKQQADGSVRRRWEMEYTIKPQHKAKAAAEARFYSLLDQ